MAELARQNQMLKRELRRTVRFPFDTKGALGVMTKADSISLNNRSFNKFIAECGCGL